MHDHVVKVFVQISKFSSFKKSSNESRIDSIIKYIVLKNTIQTLNFTHNFLTKNCEIQK